MKGISKVISYKSKDLSSLGLEKRSSLLLRVLVEIVKQFQDVLRLLLDRPQFERFDETQQYGSHEELLVLQLTDLFTQPSHLCLVFFNGRFL
jgi:hypothetical protein